MYLYSLLVSPVIYLYLKHNKVPYNSENGGFLFILFSPNALLFHIYITKLIKNKKNEIVHIFSVSLLDFFFLSYYCVFIHFIPEQQRTNSLYNNLFSFLFFSFYNISYFVLLLFSLLFLFPQKKYKS